MNINVTIFGQTIAFIIFVIFCMKYVWPPIMTAIENRQREIAEGFVFVERAKKDLDLAQIKIINELKKAKDEAQIIIEQAHKRRSQILDEAKIEAEIERNRVLAQAQSKINIEYLRAREELRKQVALLILSGSEKILERSVDESVNKDIINKLITEL